MIINILHWSLFNGYSSNFSIVILLIQFDVVANLTNTQIIIVYTNTHKSDLDFKVSLCYLNGLKTFFFYYIKNIKLKKQKDKVNLCKNILLFYFKRINIKSQSSLFKANTEMNIICI